MAHKVVKALRGSRGALARAVNVALALVLLVGICVPGASFAPQEADAATGQFSHNGDNRNLIQGEGSASGFESGSVYTDGTGRTAYCIEAGAANPSPSVDYVFKGYANSRMAAILDNGYPNTTVINGVQLSTDQARQATQTALYAHTDYHSHGINVNPGNFRATRGTAGADAASAAAYWLANTAAYYGSSSQYEVWGPSDTSSGFQIMLKTQNPPGNIALNKSSANGDITNGNGCYSLSGAVYGVYDGGGNEVASMTTDSNGYARADGIKQGSYTVREKSAPAGYALDGGSYNVDVKSRQTSNVYVSDQPQGDPDGALVQKLDSITGESSPEGDGTLAGAEFTVKYYAAGDPSGNAVRTWTYRTDSDGMFSMSFDTPVSGDALYTDTNGMTIFPLGNYTVQETKAPEGYVLGAAPVHYANAYATGSGETDVTWSYHDDWNKIELNGQEAGAIGDKAQQGDWRAVKEVSPTVDNENPNGPDGGYDGNNRIIVPGIQFQLINQSANAVAKPEGGLAQPGEVVCTVTTDENGLASTRNADANGWSIPDGWSGALAYGTYKVHEVVPDDVNAKYKAEHGGDVPTVSDWTATISSDGQYDAPSFVNDKSQTPLKIVKKDVETGKTVPLQCSFQLYDSKGNLVKYTTHYPEEVSQDTWTTSSKGEVTLPFLLNQGTYTVREVQAPDGYTINKDPIQLTVDSSFRTWDDPLVIECKDMPIKGTVKVQKTDSDTGSALAGAKFTVTAAQDIVTGDGTVRAKKGDVVSTLTTGSDGTAETGLLYLGTYTVVETEAPDGYALDETPHSVTLVSEGQDVPVVHSSAKVTDKPTKLYVQKTDSETGAAVPGAVFRLYDPAHDDTYSYASADQVEKAVQAALAAAYDPDGIEDAVKKGAAAAGEDASNTSIVDAESLAKSVQNGKAGDDIPFTATVAKDAGTHVDTDENGNARGVSGVGITPLKCSAHLNEDKTIDVTVEGADGTFQAPAKGYANADEIAIEDKDGLNDALSGAYKGQLLDIALSGVPKDDLSTDGRVAAGDLRADDEAVSEYLDKHGYSVEENTNVQAEEAAQDQTPIDAAADAVSTAAGNVADAVTGAATAAAGTVTGIVNGGSDDGQQATDDQGGSSTREQADEGTAPEAAYTVEAAGDHIAVWHDGTEVCDVPSTLVKAGDANAYSKTVTTDEDGKAELDYVPHGTYKLEEVSAPDGYNFNHDDAVKDVVVNEKGWIGESSPDKYSDTMTVSMTNMPVDIHTTATEGGDSDACTAEETTIDDVVQYKGLTPGKEHTMTGTLHLQQPVYDEEGNQTDTVDAGVLTDADGKPVTAKAVFTPEASSGAVTLHFTFDSSLLAGQKVVAFESCSNGKKTVATHADIGDEGQTVEFHVNIGTTATDTRTGNHASPSVDGKTVLKDTVDYDGAAPSKTYTMAGTLMNQQTAEAVTDANGDAVTASGTFTATDKTGSTDIYFQFDSNQMAGSSTVAFEKLYEGDVDVPETPGTSQQGDEKDDSGDNPASDMPTPIATHEDIDDAGQTVTFPDIHTTLTDSSDGDHEVTGDGTVTLDDEVTYDKVQPGAPITFTGTLMDKATGKAVADSDGNPITAQTQMTPDTASGTATVTFTFDASDMSGDVVAFEKAYDTGTDTLIATHENLSDEGQTVKIVKPGEESPLSSLPKTFDDFMGWLPVLVLLLGGGAGAYYAHRRAHYADREGALETLFFENSLRKK